MVNSRHNDCIIKTDLNITGLTDDNIIEIIESSKNVFFVGLQWHPESMIDYDIDSNNIFKYFIRGSLNGFKPISEDC